MINTNSTLTDAEWLEKWESPRRKLFERLFGKKSESEPAKSEAK